MSNEAYMQYLEERKKEHGDSIIYEDRFAKVHPESVDITTQRCCAVDESLTPCCGEPGVYVVSGRYTSKAKGSRAAGFQKNLCAKHCEVWCHKYGLAFPPEGSE